MKSQMEKLLSADEEKKVESLKQDLNKILLRHGLPMGLSTLAVLGIAVFLFRRTNDDKGVFLALVDAVWGENSA